jgi:hypothetical protein
MFTHGNPVDFTKVLRTYVHENSWREKMPRHYQDQNAHMEHIPDNNVHTNGGAWEEYQLCNKAILRKYVGL